MGAAVYTGGLPAGGNLVRHGARTSSAEEQSIIRAQARKQGGERGRTSPDPQSAGDLGNCHGPNATRGRGIVAAKFSAPVVGGSRIPPRPSADAGDGAGNDPVGAIPEALTRGTKETSHPGRHQIRRDCQTDRGASGRKSGWRN